MQPPTMTRLRTERPSGPASCGAVQSWLCQLLAVNLVSEEGGLAGGGGAGGVVVPGGPGGGAGHPPAGSRHTPALPVPAAAAEVLVSRQGLYVVLPVGAAAADRAGGGGGAAQERVRQPAGDLDSLVVRGGVALLTSSRQGSPQARAGMQRLCQTWSPALQRHSCRSPSHSCPAPHWLEFSHGPNSELDCRQGSSSSSRQGRTAMLTGQQVTALQYHTSAKVCCMYYCVVATGAALLLVEESNLRQTALIIQQFLGTFQDY